MRGHTDPLPDPHGDSTTGWRALAAASSDPLPDPHSDSTTGWGALAAASSDWL